MEPLISLLPDQRFFNGRSSDQSHPTGPAPGEDPELVIALLITATRNLAAEVHELQY
jgi:hypothetical protein